MRGMFGAAIPGRAPLRDRFEQPLREVMCPGVIVISEAASVTQAQRALLAHDVHAILVLDGTGRPLGWATSAGLLAFADRDAGLLTARDAVTETAIVLESSASVREALDVLRKERVTRVIVSARYGSIPEGVVAEHDLLAAVVR
jgi:CBS domain-containing protein